LSREKIVDFENKLSDLITEIFTDEDVKDLEEYFGDTTIISIIREELGIE